MNEKTRLALLLTTWLLQPVGAAMAQHARGLSDLLSQGEDGDLHRSLGRLPGVFGVGTQDLDLAMVSTRAGRARDKDTALMKTRADAHLPITLDTSYKAKNVLNPASGAAKAGRGFWEMKASSAVGAALPGLEANFAVSSFDPDSGEGFHDINRRSSSLGAYGSLGGLGYGVKYFSVGSEFERLKKEGKTGARDAKKDREGTEAWVHGKFGKVGIKSFVTRYHDNLDEDPSRPRYTDQKFGGTVTYTILSWPYLGYSATYARGIRMGSNGLEGSASYRGSLETVANALDYSGEKWSASVAAEYSKSGDLSGPVEIAAFYLGGSYYPSDSLSLTPNLSWMEEVYPESAVNTLTRSADLSLAYNPPNSKLKFTAYGGYSASENSDWGFDNRYFYGYAGLDWSAPNSAPKGTVSLQVGFDRYVDQIYADASTGNVSIWLNFRASLDSRGADADRGARLNFLSGARSRW